MPLVVPIPQRRVSSAGPSQATFRSSRAPVQRSVTPSFINARVTGPPAPAYRSARSATPQAFSGGREGLIDAGRGVQDYGAGLRNYGRGIAAAADAEVAGIRALSAGASDLAGGARALGAGAAANVAGARAIAASAGAGAARIAEIGDGISSLGAGLQQLELRRQETELKTLDVEFSNFIRDAAYGNPEAGQEGYLSTQNDDAVNGHLEFRKAIAEKRQELVDKAGSNQVRDRFSVAAAGRVNSVFTQAAQHANRQEQAVSELVTKARIDNAKNDAANNPATLNKNLATIQSEMTSLAVRQGVRDPEVIGNLVLSEQSSAISLTVSTTLSQDNPSGASDILRTYGGMMTGADRAKASVSVMRSLVTEQAQGLADEIRSLGLSGQEAIEYARENTTGAVRDDLVQRLDTDERRRRLQAAADKKDEVDDLPERAQALFDEIQELDLSEEQQIEYARENATGKHEDSVVTRLRQEHADERTRAAEDRRQAVEDVDGIMETLIAEETDPDQREALLSEWRENDPNKFTATMVRQVKDRLTRQENQERLEKAAATDEALSKAALAINEEGTSLSDFFSSNPVDAALIRGSYEAYTKAQGLDRNQRHGDRFAEVSDGSTLHRLRQMNAKDRLAINLEAEPNLTEQEFNEASRMQAMDQHMKEESHDATYASVRRVLGRMIDRKYDYTSPGKQSASDRRYNQDVTMHSYIAAYDYIQENGGKAPDEITLSRLVSSAIQSVVVNDGGIFGLGLFGESEADFSTLRNLGADQIQSASKDYDEIPLDVRNRVTAYAAEHGTKYVDVPPPEGVIEIATAMWLIYDSDNANKALAMARFNTILGVD